MSKIYLFLPDFKALVKETALLPESVGFNHPVFYYEDEFQIYFYKPIDSFVYCYQSPKVNDTGEVTILGLTVDVIDELKQKFRAIEVPQMLYVSNIETTTHGVIKQ